VTTASPLQASQSELERELTLALEQQAATSAILRSISSSPTDLQLVLMAVAENAARLCNADVSQILRIDGDFLQVIASHGPIPSRLRGETIRINRNSVAGRAVVDREIIHVHDLLAELDTEFPDAKPYSKLWGHRTTLAAPLLRQGIPIGAIFIRRTEVRPFSDRHIEVLKPLPTRPRLRSRTFTLSVGAKRRVGPHGGANAWRNGPGC
jgi:transcriptional regulator with GAF, ATPase, and Fis domain